MSLKAPTILFWFLGFCLAIVGIEIAYANDLLQYIFFNDATYISYAIAALTLWQSLSCAKELAYPSLDSGNLSLERGWMWSDLVLSLGMVGTVIGFMMMLAGFADLDISNISSAQEMITQLGAGMATALTTTLVGLISSIVLKLQFFMLENFLKKMSDA